MSFADQIKDLRRSELLTQEEFAALLKVSFSSVNRWENAKTLPNLSVMKRIRAYCEETGNSFEHIENTWLSEKE